MAVAPLKKPEPMTKNKKPRSGAPGYLPFRIFMGIYHLIHLIPRTLLFLVVLAMYIFNGLGDDDPWSVDDAGPLWVILIKVPISLALAPIFFAIFCVSAVIATLIPWVRDRFGVAFGDLWDDTSIREFRRQDRLHRRGKEPFYQGELPYQPTQTRKWS